MGRQRPLETFIGFLDAFQGGEHGDGGSDDPVAEEQGGPEDPEQDQHAAVLAFAVFLALRGGERDQGHDTPLAVVVGLHDEHDVFNRHDADEGPDDHRNRGDDAGRDIRPMGHASLEAFPEGVQGAGADIPEDHAERGDHGGGGQRFTKGRGGCIVRLGGHLLGGFAHVELFTIPLGRG